MRSTCIALLSLTLIGCSGRDAVRVGVEVRGGTTEQAEATAKAILAELPDTALRENIGHRLPGVPLNGLALTTSTRTERNHPAGGETTVKVWLECEVFHRSGVAGANEAADACREELESALVAKFGRGSVGSGWKTFSRLSYGLGAVSC
jgi:hypothetical protein